MTYKQVRINITRPQLEKALKGLAVRFGASQIGNGENFLSLHPENVKKVEKSAMKGTGCCINLSEGELLASAEDMNGEGIFSDIFKGLKSGYNWTKKNVINTDIYQRGIKPIVKRAVDTGVDVAGAFVPELKPALNIVKDKISKETGAFGLRTQKKSKAQRRQLLVGKGLYLS